MPSPDVRYWIDAGDRISQVDAGWTRFAETNAGEALSPERVRGQVLWDFIADATTVHLYRLLCARVRELFEPVRIQFRCDAPDRRRLLALAMTPLEGSGIEFHVSPLAEEVRPPVPLLGQAPAVSAERLMSMCGWCKRVRSPEGEWVEVERAIPLFAIFERTPVPAITHGICATCEDKLQNALDAPSGGVVQLGSLEPSPT